MSVVVITKQQLNKAIKDKEKTIIVKGELAKKLKFFSKLNSKPNINPTMPTGVLAGSVAVAGGVPVIVVIVAIVAIVFEYNVRLKDSSGVEVILERTE